MSTDETPGGESIERPDAAARPEPEQAGSGVAAATPEQAGSGVAAATRAELRDIESAPLAERAVRYQELADRLRSELEHSDPSRGPS